jgi:AAA domain/UvrD-like helicase C-terminal domain
VARLAIAKGFLGEYAQLDQDAQGPEELRLILAHPFAAWRTFLHPSQRDIAYQASYAGSAQVTGGPGTGKTVTVLHRAALLAKRAPHLEHSEHFEPPVLLTTFNGNLAHALAAQLDLLVSDAPVRQQIEVLNVDRLAYRIVKQARGTPVIADEREVNERWAKAAADAGLDLTPAFGKNEWEQVILAQDLRTEQAYLTCQRAGRGRPLSKAQRGLLWRAAEQVTAGLAAARTSTHLQLADEASRLLQGAPRYRHILVDEAQDLHPSQWRLLRAAVAPGPDDLFIAADPHQRVYQNRVSLASLRISVRGRSRRLSLNYRTTQEILAWAVPLLGTDPVTGLDGEVDSLLGYRSPRHGPRPERGVAATRTQEFTFLAERLRSWLATGIEPHAIGVAARSAGLVREARQALGAEGIATASLGGRAGPKAVRVGTMHAMKGLEFQAVAVIGVEQGLVPWAVTPETEDAATHAQDLQRERCVLFVACTRARDHLYVSGTGEPSEFLPSGAVAAPPERELLPAASLPRLFRLLLARRGLDPGLDAESFLTWATAPGRRLRLAELDVSVRRFLVEDGDQAVDLVDRCLDLLDRLAAREPDLAGAQLPSPFIHAARQETGALTAAPSVSRGPAAPSLSRRPPGPPPRPRIRLDPDAPALQLILPAPAAPDGVTSWRVTVDGDPATVRSRAVTPPTAYPLTRPVRTVHVSLAGVSLAGADQVTELEVVPPSDPVLFFAADGRHLPARLPLPPDLLWILRPADRELVAAGQLRAITPGPVPPGWEGWRLELASLEQASSVSLRGGPAHAVSPRPRPRLLPGELVPTHPQLSPQPHPEPRPHPQPLASGAEISSGQLTIRDRARADGLAAALYLARAPWREPVVVPVPADGVLMLPRSVSEAGPLLVQLHAEDPSTIPDWPGRAAYTCPAPGIPACADTEEEALSRFLAGQRDLPVRPRQLERLWRLIYLAADLIAAGAPADLRERCSAVLANQPGRAMTGLLDAGLDAGACVVGLISTGLAAARPVMMDDPRVAERLWDIVPAAAAVLSSRLIAGPTCPDEDPAAVVVEAALARCGPSLAAILRGAGDPHAQAAVPEPPPAAVVPQPLLDADTRAAAARQLFAARRTPELARAAQDAAAVVGSAERLVAASPYRRAISQIAARRPHALPAMSASLALVARISARGDQDCRAFERAWRPRWTDLARQAPDLTSIDLVLAEAQVAATDRARFG